MSSPRWSPLALLPLCLFVLTACGGADEGPETPGEVSALSVVPAEGPPGTLLVISGLSPEQALAEGLSASLGAEPLALLMHEDGTLLATVPLYLAEDGWPAPPEGPQTLRVMQGGEAVGEAKDAVRVTELQDAPGATREALAAALEIVAGAEGMLAGLSIEEGTMDQYRHAILHTLRGLVTGGENSLQAVVEGSAPLLEGEAADLRLADALLASSGALLAAQQMAERMGGLGGAGEGKLTTQALLCTTYSPDAELACDMQLYEVAKELGKTVIHDTATTFGQIVGTIFGATCLQSSVCMKPRGGSKKMGVAARTAAIVGAILTVADFYVNKVAVGLLPAKLTAFELSLPPEFEAGLIKQGETLKGIVEVSAVNDPPAITLNDVIGSLLSLIGARSPSPTNPNVDEQTRELLGSVAEYAANLMSAGLSAYADAHPKLNLDVEISKMPQKTWGPLEITDDRLIEAFSFQEDLLAVTDSPLGAATWLASEEKTGEARINVRTAGQDGKIINYSGYTGGAFGNEQRSTEALIVCVDGPPILKVVSISPEAIAADTEASQTYTLTYQDDCANVETIRNEVTLLPQEVGAAQEVGTDAAFVSGFEAAAGEGYWVADVFVSCDYADDLLQGSKRNGFTIKDSFGVASETLYTYTTVDYSKCQE